MQRATVHNFAEAEHRELEAVVAHLERTPRLAALLVYLAQKYFDGETDQLTEYNIATEVFERKKSEFVASDDAIARVETHRLRKKLKAFYETEGKDHGLRVLIPAGSYTPVFVEHEGQGTPSPKSPAEAVAALPEPSSPPRPDAASETQKVQGTALPLQASDAGLVRTRRLITALYLFFGVLTVLIVLSAIYYRLRTSASRPATGPASGAALPASAVQRSGAPLPGSVTLPFRMIAGYSGPPQRDSAGDAWQADQYFHEGWPEQQPPVFFSRTSDPMIFRAGRAGDFTYDIPLKPGLYELHLYFLQLSDTDQSEDAANKAIFNVSINGEVALRSFDIVSDAMGRNTADERVLRDISPAADGFLHLKLSTVVGTPSLSALKIVEGTAHKQLPIRIMTQPVSYTDHDGQMWHPDDYFLGGRHLAHTLPTSASVSSDMLMVERYGHFSYALPVDPRDRFTVVLHFAELYYGMDGSGTGSRVFRVLCNGTTLLDDFDIYKEAGSLHMLTRTFHHLKPTAQGKLNLTFEPISDYATVSAIEVIDESN